MHVLKERGDHPANTGLCLGCQISGACWELSSPLTACWKVQLPSGSNGHTDGEIKAQSLEAADLPVVPDLKLLTQLPHCPEELLLSPGRRGSIGWSIVPYVILQKAGGSIPGQHTYLS